MFNVLSKYVQKSTTHHFSIENYWQGNRLITIKTEIKNMLIFTSYSRTRQKLIVPDTTEPETCYNLPDTAETRNRLKFTSYNRTRHKLIVPDTTEPETG